MLVVFAVAAVEAEVFASLIAGDDDDEGIVVDSVLLLGTRFTLANIDLPDVGGGLVEIDPPSGFFLSCSFFVVEDDGLVKMLVVVVAAAVVVVVAALANGDFGDLELKIPGSVLVFLEEEAPNNAF